MNARRQTANLAHWVSYVLPGLFVLIPLVFDADLYRFAYLPKLVVLQVGVLLLATVIARNLSSGRAMWNSSPTFLPAVLYLLLSLCSVGAATNVFTATAFLAYQLTLFLLYVVVSQTTTDVGIERVVRWACATGTVFSLIGILEFWGVDTSAIPSNGRPSSTFAYRNFAGTYLIALLPLAAFLVLRARKWLDLGLGLTAGLLMSLFLVYTRSRGAWLGAVVGFGTMLALFLTSYGTWLDRRAVLRTRHGLIALTCAALLFLSLAPVSPTIRSPHSREIDEGKTELLDAMTSFTAPGGSRGRWTLWSHTIDMISEHAILGVGLGNWKLIYPAYDDDEMIRVGSAPERPHNDFLWIAAESGIPSLIAYVWILVVALFAGLSLIRRREKSEHIVGALICGLIAVTVHSFFSFPRERVESSFFVWAVLGLISALTTQAPIRIDRRIPMLMPALAAACLAITSLEIRFDRALLGALQSLAGEDFIGLARHTGEGVGAGPFDSRIFLLQNKVFQSQQNYTRAQEACLKGLQYHPNSPELYGDLGMAYARAGDSNRAEQALLRAIDLSPAQYQTLNNLGGVYQQRDDLDRALDAYQKALQLKPDYVDALSNMGLLHTRRGAYDAAVASIEQALAITGSRPGLNHNLADALYLRGRKGDLQRAARLYQAFLLAWRGDPAETQIARIRVREMASP